MVAAEGEPRAQIERILKSETLRSSGVLKLLLKFLAEKSFSGEVDQLKEYSIAIDGLGKPASYDPQHDSTVRIQVGRLRQKLAEYYITEGKDDPVVIELPKGRFVLSWHERIPAPVLASAISVTAAVEPPRPSVPTWRRTVLTSVVIASLVVTCAYSNWRLWEERRATALFRSQWTPELNAIWSPFLSSERPLLVAIPAPLFVRFTGLGYFRDRTINKESDIATSKSVATLQKSLNVPSVQPMYFFANIGEVSVSFMLGKLLAPRAVNMSIVKSTELSWQQVSENNVLFIGQQKVFNEQMNGKLGFKEEFVADDLGFRNVHPKPGEPVIFFDHFQQDDLSDGEAHVLISHMSGPLGKGDILCFDSRRAAGRIAAVQWLTEPASARIMYQKLKSPDGTLPRFYQVLLKVRFQRGVPVENSYVLHREIPAS